MKRRKYEPMPAHEKRYERSAMQPKYGRNTRDERDARDPRDVRDIRDQRRDIRDQRRDMRDQRKEPRDVRDRRPPRNRLHNAPPSRVTDRNRFRSRTRRLDRIKNKAAAEQPPSDAELQKLIKEANAQQPTHAHKAQFRPTELLLRMELPEHL
eukprot:TRINITY_DN1582_c0_g1_i1.p1 TRINITY_DN1582_c0_g1~~TRINITY_DN1582_c0_g1_i1.p1  ORF type:complete len:153 (-),score=21.91 TRINITY_DN1582_c0_g1_i1:93-551(-)